MNKKLEKMIIDNPKCQWGTGLIFDQHTFPRIKGTYGPLGTVAGCGCGGIAIHNVRTLLGENGKFATVLREVDADVPCSVMALGLFGTSIGYIGRYLRRKGYKVQMYTLDNVPFDCDAYIMCYLHSQGGHYVAAIKQANGKYRTYNNPNDEFLSLRHAADKMESKGMLIYGINK